MSVLVGRAVLLWMLGPRGTVAAFLTALSRALPVSVAHAQSMSTSANAVDVAVLSHHIEDYMSEVYAFAGENVAVERGPDGDNTTADNMQ